MSFAYMPLYTGDYLRDTQHLSCSEHGIYLRLLMHCWDQKGPAPLDERKLCGIVNARSSDEIEALRRVLGEFFVRMIDGFYNHRIQHEIERCEAISGARSEAGRRGYQAKAKQLPNKSRTVAEQVPLSPSPSPSITPTPEEESIQRGVPGENELRSPRASRSKAPAATRAILIQDLVSEGVDEKHARDWLSVRRAKHAPLTQTAWEAVKREARKASLSPADAVRAAAENGWQGFKAQWMKTQPRTANPFAEAI